MRREEEPGGRERESSGVERGERSPLFSSKVVECISNKEVVTVSRHIIEVSQYRTLSIFLSWIVVDRGSTERQEPENNED